MPVQVGRDIDGVVLRLSSQIIVQSKARKERLAQAAKGDDDDDDHSVGEADAQA
jgi:phage terminase small subunit